MSKLVVSGAVALERASASTLQPWQEPDWQRLWLATHSREREWRSLALLPGSAGMPARFMERVAVGLSRTGMTHLGDAIHVADATHVRLEELSGFLDEVTHCTASGERRLVIALAALDENVTSVSIAQHVDRVLLCVLRGHTEMSAVRRTVRDVGKTRFLGSVMFDGLD